MKQLGGIYTLSHLYWHCFDAAFCSVLCCKGAPAVLRSDLGTENTTLAFIQPYLRQQGTVLLVKIASVTEDPLQIRHDITLLACECT